MTVPEDHMKTEKEKKDNQRKSHTPDVHSLVLPDIKQPVLASQEADVVPTERVVCVGGVVPAVVCFRQVKELPREKHEPPRSVVVHELQEVEWETVPKGRADANDLTSSSVLLRSPCRRGCRLRRRQQASSLPGSKTTPAAAAVAAAEQRQKMKHECRRGSHKRARVSTETETDHRNSCTSASCGAGLLRSL